VVLVGNEESSPNFFLQYGADGFDCICCNQVKAIDDCAYIIVWIRVAVLEFPDEQSWLSDGRVAHGYSLFVVW
jgi:hypothetical protein